MGLLYPRLLPDQAVPMHEQYRKLVISELTECASTTHPAAVYVATGGARVSAEKLRELRGLVVDIAKEAGFPGESNREARGAFDLKLAVALHTAMDVVPAEAASGDVWAFLALVLLPDVAYWRYPRPPGDRVLGTDLTRHTFGRMWWRAQLVHSPEDHDPYAALSVLGEAAFDQIYARRKALGGSPYLVRAILRVWNGLDRQGVPERAVLRDFLMRLLRLGPFLLFEALSEESLDAELRVAAEESVQALRGSASTSQADVTPPEQRPDVPSEHPEPILPDGGEAERRRGEEQPPRSDRPAPYSSYEGPGFGDPRELGLHTRAEAIAAVVKAEGPVKALRVYRFITRAAGIQLRETVEAALVAATKYAIRTGMIQAENQLGRDGYPGATLRLAAQPVCVLRDHGPRDLDEIPDRELVAAANAVLAEESIADIEALAKKTSRLFGYGQSTARFKMALVEALQKYGDRP